MASPWLTSKQLIAGIGTVMPMSDADMKKACQLPPSIDSWFARMVADFNSYGCGPVSQDEIDAWKNACPFKVPPPQNTS